MNQWSVRVVRDAMRGAVRGAVRAVLPLCVVIGSVPAQASAQVRAQRVMADATVDAAENAVRASSILSKPITISLDRVSLSRALDAVAERAAIRIHYRSELVDPVVATVTLRATQQPLGAVLDRVLAGTQLQAVPSDESVITIKAAALQPQPSDGVIVGQVLDGKTRRPVAGATVTIGDGTQSVISDADGRYRIVVRAGEHQVTVRAVGFTRHVRRVTVAGDQTVTADVTLSPSTSVLDEVVVTGTVVATERKAIATPITVINADDIEKRGITRIEQLFRGDVPGILALDPGVQRYAQMFPSADNPTVGMAGTSVYSRGSASLDGKPNPIKTYIDGVEILDPAYLGTIDPKSIERIEIITGPQAATVYGSGAMGGVMQIFTKKGSGADATQVTFSAKYGMLENNLSKSFTPSHDDAISITGGTGPGFSYSANLSHVYTGQWQPNLFARNYGFSLGATHTRGPFVFTGTASTMFGRNGTYQWGSVAPTIPSLRGSAGSLLELAMHGNGVLVPTQYYRQLGKTPIAESMTQTGGINIDLRPTAFWQHHLTLGVNQTDFQLNSPTPQRQSPSDTLRLVNRSTGRRTSAGYNMTLVPSHLGPLTSTLTAGLNGSWSTGFSLSGYLPVQTATSLSYPYGVQPIDTKSYGGFGQLQLGLADQLFVTFGLRGERNPTYGGDHAIDWTPTNGVTYTLEHGDVSIKFNGSYGRATRPPQPAQRDLIMLSDATYEPNQYIYQVANPDLTPEYSRGPQGGIEVYYGSLLSMSVNHYVQRVTDLIQQVTVDSVIRTRVSDGSQYYHPLQQYRNVANMRQQGWEGTGSLTLGIVKFTGTYSWTDTRVTPKVGAPTLFFWLPTHTGSFAMEYAYGATSMRVTSNYIGKSSQRLAFINIEQFISVYQLTRIPTYQDRVLYYGMNVGIPGYVKTDLTASHRINRSVTATLNVTNLGNSYRSDASALNPTLGRQTLLGLSVRYP